MSEAGIYAETNIRLFEPQLACVSTNPGKPRRCTQTFMQTMLTQYSTIQEILDHVNDYDWFDLQKLGFHQAFLLSDRTGYSVIIEFGGNSVVWEESNHNANFFINKELYAKETIGCGEKRLEHEYAVYDTVKKPEDIFFMMKEGAYDQFYHSNVDLDYAIPEFYEEIGYNRFTYEKDSKAAREAVKKIVTKYDDYSWEERVSNHTWETVFMVVANVSDCEMNVHFSEHYNIDFKLSF